MYISRENIRDYLYCPYKAYLKFQGSSGKITDYEKLQNQLWKIYYPAALEKTINEIGKNSVSHNPHNCLSEMKLGSKIIVNSFLNYRSFQIQFDVLTRISCARQNIHCYEPTIFFSEESRSKETNLLLSIVGILLGNIQGNLPHKAKGVFGHKSRIHTIKPSTLSNKALSSLDDIEGLFKSQSEPEFYLNKHCDICEFHKICAEKSQKEDDLSLLRGISKAEIKKQRSRGIFTVTQFSYTFRPRKQRKGVQISSPKRHYSLQARAIREQKVHVFQKPNLNLHPVQIYMDVEGLPDEGFNYLIGMLVIETHKNCKSHAMDIPIKVLTSWKNLVHKMKGATQSFNTKMAEKQVLLDTETLGAKFYSLWANNAHQENDIFEIFLQIITHYSQFQLFHYGSYEKRYLKRIYKISTLKNKRKINRIVKNSHDVLSLIYPSIYLPTYSNRLKDIGKYIGHCWSSDDATGIQSIVWRKKWELLHSDEIRNELIIYNIEDCLCLMEIVYFLLPLLNPDFPRASNVIYAEDLKTEIAGRVWGKVDFVSDDIEYVTKAAYFDYQKEKISLRPNKMTRSKRRRSQGLPKYRVNKRLIIRCRKCTYCGSSAISPAPEKRENKTTFDLKFFKTGLKRRIVEYSVENYECQNCERNFYSRRKRDLKKYSHALKSWVVYQYVANRMSLENIERYMGDIFDLSISYHSINRIKTQLANYYKTTYLKIKKQILSGNVIYVDETKIKLQKEIGYVWVFANHHEVFFLFRKSREGKFLDRYLINFPGVLVSDFFAAYDNVPCDQQKCLVHLIRDINNDLLKHPKSMKKTWPSFISLFSRQIFLQI
jgi:predicted RecB family nuclease